jgi:5-methylcytosine-specific restriction endonuclease McrA
VFERDEGICGICGEPVAREEFDVDHVIPLALGGEHSYANVRLSHVPCNRRRGRSVSLEAAAVTVQ